MALSKEIFGAWGGLGMFCCLHIGNRFVSLVIIIIIMIIRIIIVIIILKCR